MKKQNLLIVCFICCATFLAGEIKAQQVNPLTDRSVVTKIAGGLGTQLQMYNLSISNIVITRPDGTEFTFPNSNFIITSEENLTWAKWKGSTITAYLTYNNKDRDIIGIDFSSIKFTVKQPQGLGFSGPVETPYAAIVWTDPQTGATCPFNKMNFYKKNAIKIPITGVIQFYTSFR